MVELCPEATRVPHHTPQHWTFLEHSKVQNKELIIPAVDNFVIDKTSEGAAIPQLYPEEKRWGIQGEVTAFFWVIGWKVARVTDGSRDRDDAYVDEKCNE
jgi:hypothetical protein